MGVLRLVNGLPTMVAAYDQSQYFATGLAANTPITLPSSGSFTSSVAADLLVEMNGITREQGASRDFTVVGAGPTFTQIQFNYALPNDAVVRFKQNI